MQFKITFKSELYALQSIIMITIAYVLLFLGLYIGAVLKKLDIHEVLAFLSKLIFWITLVFYLPFCLIPVIILHYNYKKKSPKLIEITENNLIVNDKVYTPEKIDIVNVFATYRHFKGFSGGSIYSPHYYYMEFILKDGERFVLSSLLGYKLDAVFRENFRTVKIIERRSPFLLLIIPTMYPNLK
ncbi:hypothetical protein CMU70_11375 [Elizabethkingia anophelis]|nr:hypothetical protein [Elizabethkingia anophelis]